MAGLACGVVSAAGRPPSPAKDIRGDSAGKTAESARRPPPVAPPDRVDGPWVEC